MFRVLFLILCGGLSMSEKIEAYRKKEISVVGHRGASGYELENTLRSFARAIDMGVDMIELDVHLCASGELVVFHDEKVDRITNGQGYIADKTLEQLKQLDLSDGQKIPTLAEVFDLVDRKVIIDIELKGADTALPVAELITYYVEHKNWSYEDFFVTSFNHHELLFFKLQCPMVSVGPILSGLPLLLAKFAEQVCAHAVVLDKKYINAAIVDDAHNRGKKVYVFTVNEIDDIELMYNLGVDGIISDYPDRVQAVLH